MIRKYTLPLVTVGMLAFAIFYALHAQRPEPNPPPPMPPPVSPYGNTVAGAGMVEPSTIASGTAAIAVGSQLAGVITKVHVDIGQEVKQGDLLFELDQRQARADLKARAAAVSAAQANLRKLELQPRPEEVPVAEAVVHAAQANFKNQQDQWERAERLWVMKGIAEQDYIITRQNHHNARAQLEQAQASLALLKAGAWEADKAIARANIELARAQLEQAQTTVDLLQVKAPVDATILQVNIRPGEYVTTNAGQSLILLGNLNPLHVRVNVDEEDVPRLRLYAPARARLRGDLTQQELPLTFVRLEPYVVPKVSLTGANTERVDTRVAQVIYALDCQHPLVRDKKVLLGQLIDVFIDVSPSE
jgi:multidrug resistance efflux pump